MAHDAAEDKHFKENVLPARIRLHKEVTDALSNMKSATATLHALESNKAFDVEYEGGSRFADYLDEARRLLAIGIALMPTGADGNYVQRDVRNEALDGLMRGGRLP